MKIVKVKGGLGNQMFQYAFAKKIEKQCNEIIKLDFSAYKELEGDVIRKPRILRFNLTLPVANKDEIINICNFKHEGKSSTLSYRVKLILEMLTNKSYFYEKDRRFITVDENMLSFNYFDGYWQSWRYVDDVFDTLQNDFLVQNELANFTKSLINKVENENSVFVGVRRGDYLDESRHYGQFGQEYYSSAMEYIEGKVENPVYYIFSNDIEWVKDNLDFGTRNVYYREAEQVVDDFEELQIMMNCKHSIIVNSTYHWWGARMKDNPQKIVIAPKKWFFDEKPIDIVPPHWIKM